MNFRNLETWFWRQRLRNHDFSIISSNCLGAMVTHDLHKRHNSPTVNLWMKPSDFIAFLSDLDASLNGEIVDITCRNPYPVGLLNGRIKLWFMHYNSFSEAIATWKRRAERVNKDNLYVVMTERDGCSYDDLKAFDRLPYKNKVVFVHKLYPDIKSAFVIQKPESNGEVGLITECQSRWSRFYDVFPWTRFLNQSMY